MMTDVKKLLVKIFAGVLVFLAFSLILSPLYIYRSVVLKLTYSSPRPIEISAAHLRYPADVFTGRFYMPETFTLPASPVPHTVSQELPVENRVGGLRLNFIRTDVSLKLYAASFLNHGREYAADIQNGVVNHESSSHVVKSADFLTVKSGKNTVITFPCSDYMYVSRNFDPVMALYMAMIALLPAILVFRKINADCSLKGAVDLIYSAIALLMLTMPVLLIDYYGKVSDENRFMNPFPSLLVQRRINVNFPRQFEDWLSDRFTGRKTAIQNERRIFTFWSGRTENSQSQRGFYGKDNWMFAGHTQNVDMFLNKNRFTEDQLRICADKISKLDKYCSERNIKLYVMLTPDKERVYPECYPDKYNPVHPESRLEQLYRYCTGHTSVKIIFPLHELRRAKEQYPVYFKTGTHWTPRGAYIAYRMLLEELQKDFPDVPAEQPNASQWTESLSADTDIARLLGYSDPQKQLPPEMLKHDAPAIQCGYWERFMTPQDVYTSSLNLFTASAPRNNGLKVFACTDSFWSLLLPFMFPASNQLLHAYFGGGNAFDLHTYKAFIEDFKPDVIVIESTERFLDRFLTISIDED